MNTFEIDVAILCGGLGMRLRPELGETPKVMAPVGGHPFLEILIQQLAAFGLERIILCTGYKAQEVEDYFRQKKGGLKIEFSREEEPLGTGGALKNAQGLFHSDPFLLLNGDCFCPLDWGKFVHFHLQKKAVATLAISKVKERADYGSILLGPEERIMEFREKMKSPAGQDGHSGGWVNAGAYCFSKEIFSLMPGAKKFSLEKDFFPVLARQAMYGFIVEEVFMDIGTPDRYRETIKAMEKKRS